MFAKSQNIAHRYSVVVCFLGTRLHSCASLFLKIRNPKSQPTNLAGSLDGAPIITQSRRHKPCSRSKYLTALIHSWHSMLLYYSQTVSAIATATCDLRAVALLRCAVALLLFEAKTLPPRCDLEEVSLTWAGVTTSNESRPRQKKNNFGPRHVLATEA